MCGRDPHDSRRDAGATEPYLSRIAHQRADLALLARELLRDPYWPFRAAKALHFKGEMPVPARYKRAF